MHDNHWCRNCSVEGQCLHINAFCNFDLLFHYLQTHLNHFGSSNCYLIMLGQKRRRDQFLGYAWKSCRTCSKRGRDSANYKRQQCQHSSGQSVYTNCTTDLIFTIFNIILLIKKFLKFPVNGSLCDMRKFWFIIQDELAKEGSGLARIKEKIQYIKRILLLKKQKGTRRA